MTVRQLRCRPTIRWIHHGVSSWTRRCGWKRMANVSPCKLVGGMNGTVTFCTEMCGVSSAEHGCWGRGARHTWRHFFQESWFSKRWRKGFWGGSGGEGGVAQGWITWKLVEIYNEQENFVKWLVGVILKMLHIWKWLWTTGAAHYAPNANRCMQWHSKWCRFAANISNLLRTLSCTYRMRTAFPFQ